MRQPSPNSTRTAIIILAVSFSLFMSPLWSLAASAKRSLPMKSSASPESLFVARESAPVVAAEPQAPAKVEQEAPTGGPNITATKAVSFADSDGDSKAELGETLTYTITVTENGGAQATGVTVNDTIDATRLTYVNDSVHASPIAVNETYNWVGNTQLDSSARSLPKLTDNDTTITDTTSIVAQSNVPTTQGGLVNILADGHFVYTPQAGDGGAGFTDTFNYTIRNNVDNTLTSTGTATISMPTRVWYLQAGGTGDGRSNTPSGNPSAISTAANQATDVLYVFSNASSLNGAFTLDSGQSLIGQGLALVLNLGGNNVTLFPAGTPPTITNTTGTIVALNSTGGTNTVRGLSIGAAAAAGAKISGTNFGTLTIGNNTTPDVSLAGAGTALNLTNGSFSATSGLSTLSSSGSTNAVSLTTVGGTITATGGALTATGTVFNVSGGTVSVTYAGGITQGNNAAMVSIVNHTTGTITFQTGALQATNGTGLQFDNADGTYSFNASTDLIGGDAGIDIFNGSGGTFTFGTAVNIENPSGIGYREDTSTANVTYNGPITKTNNANNAVDINAKTGGTTTFNGGIAASTTTANAIDLTNNGGGTVTFTGGLSITTTSGTGFNATGGGTVNATQNNTTILNTISTTTGTGVNIVTPTNIGGSGVTFRSITVNNGASNSAVNGIVLNGTSGAFTVAGDGATSAGSATETAGLLTRNGSGGTLSRTTGDAVSLTSATNVTLRQMNITNPALDAVHSTGGGNITLSALALTSPGASNPPSNGSTGNPSGLGGGNGWIALNITGTNLFNQNSRVFNWQCSQCNGVTVLQNGTNFTSFTVDDAWFSTSTTGADGFLFDTNNGSTTGTVTVRDSDFTLLDQDAVQVNNNGTGTITAVVQNSDFHDSDSAPGPPPDFFIDGNNTLFMALSGSGNLNFTIGGPNAADGNTFTNTSRLQALAGIIQVNAAGGGTNIGTLTGTIQNNTITNPDPSFNSPPPPMGFGNGARRRGIMVAAEASAGNQGPHNVRILNNSVQGLTLQGIYVSITNTNTGANSADILNTNFTISNNQVGNLAPIGTGGGDGGSAIEYETNPAAANTGTQFSGNLLIQGNTAVSNNSSALGGALEINNRHVGGNNTSVLNVTVLGNTLTNNNAGGETFELLNSGGDGTGAGPSTCLDLNSGNTSPNNSVGGTGGFKLTNNLGTYTIDSMGASTPSAFLGPKNQSNGSSPATITTVGTLTSSGNCATPPPIPPPAEETSANTIQGISNDSSLSNHSSQSPSDTSDRLTNRPFVSFPQQRQIAATTARMMTGGQFVINAEAAPSSAHSNAATRNRTNRAAPTVPNAPTANFPVNIGTLPQGKSVTIKFQATVANPFPVTGAASVSNQASVTGTNFAAVNTNTVTTNVDAVRLTATDVMVAEGATGTRTVTFTVALNQTTNAGAFTVQYQTADNTATAPDDYTSVPLTTLNLSGTQLTQTFTLEVKGDTVFEGNHNFFVNLSNSTGNAAILDSQGVVTIADDEPQVGDLVGAGPSDGLTDAAIWNSNNGNWVVLNSNTGATTVAANDWGRASLGDRAVPGDYDFDNKIDIAVFRPSEGNWYIIQSSTGTPAIQYWGQLNDIPVPGDYDGDGRTDFAVWRPSEGKWYVKLSGGGPTIVQNWGTGTDKPVVGDYDGDGRSDLAVFRPSEGNWYILNSSTGAITIQNWGLSTDKLVQGDYDGDGRTDQAVYRGGTWYIRNSSGGSTVRGWGDATDLAIPGDYDGDGRTDIGVWRPSEGKFYVIRSSNNTVLLQTIEVGGAGIVPVPNAYLPQ